MQRRAPYMASDRDHRWADRMVARMQIWIFVTALAIAFVTWWFGDFSASNATVSIPAIPWRPHPPIEIYR